MQIELNRIKIKDLFENYSNNDENGVVGYNGKLNIRPKFCFIPDFLQKSFISSLFWCTSRR